MYEYTVKITVRKEYMDEDMSGNYGCQTSDWPCDNTYRITSKEKLDDYIVAKTAYKKALELEEFEIMSFCDEYGPETRCFDIVNGKKFKSYVCGDTAEIIFDITETNSNIVDISM